MADSWEDDQDDWEAEADKVLGLHDVDESRFADEESTPAPVNWDEQVPTSQVRAGVLLLGALTRRVVQLHLFLPSILSNATLLAMRMLHHMCTT